MHIPDRLWRTAASLRWTPARTPAPSSPTMAHPFMLWCPGPPLSPARTSSPASPLSRPSMAEPVGDLQPWFMARVRGLYPHLPGTRPPCTQQYTRPPCWYLSRPPSLSPPCWTATWAAPCTRPPLLVRPPSGCCQSPQLQEMVATPRGFPPRTWVSPLPFLPPPPPCLLSPQVSSSRAAECSDITMSLY